MPMRFTIDPARRLVTSIVEGTLTYKDAIAHQDGLRAHLTSIRTLTSSRTSLPALISC
jgi:hypothetical protein